MKLFTPCKNCIVDPMCRKPCEKYQEYEQTRFNTQIILELVALICYLVIMIIPLTMYIFHMQSEGIDTSTYELSYAIYLPIVVWLGVKIMIKVECFLARNYRAKERN
jgi:hypothetical protein